MQTQGIKIKHLAKAIGVKMVAIAKHIGWTKSGFSRKVNSSQRFDSKTLQEIADFLRLTPEYLADETRPFNLGDTIPEDALASPPPPPPPQAEADSPGLERRVSNIEQMLIEARLSNLNRFAANDPDILKETLDQLQKDIAEKLGGLQGTILELTEELKEIKKSK